VVNSERSRRGSKTKKRTSTSDRASAARGRGSYGSPRDSLRRASRGRSMSRGEQTPCRFCRASVKYVDYKDIETLSRLLTNRGKIYSRKRSGNCAACQRKVKRAIKRARYMALLPFTA